MKRKSYKQYTMWGYWPILSVESNMGVLAHFAPWSIFRLGSISISWLKNQTRKIVKIHKDFELYYVFLWLSVSNVLVFTILLFTKRTETFSNMYFGTNGLKIIRKEKKLNYVKMTRYSQRFQVSRWLDIHKNFKWQNTLKFYTLHSTTNVFVFIMTYCCNNIFIHSFFYVMFTIA